MTQTNRKYFLDALSDAWETGRDFVDTMVEQFESDGKVSDDLLNDYPDGDGYHHEQHTDRDYDLTEAAAILDELAEWEETDDGLWQGLEPRRAIAAQAAYTYSACVYDLWRRHVVEELNDKLDALPDYEDDNDRTRAGERLIRFWVRFGDRMDDDGTEERQLLRAALAELETGNATAALALADWYDEHEQPHRAKNIRGMMK